MSDDRIRVRANRSTGEVEVEGPSHKVSEWWEKLWPLISTHSGPVALPAPTPHGQVTSKASDLQVPSMFGEFFSEFQPDISEVDKILVAGAFIQGRDPDRAFTTKAVNQLLLDQNIKVANASECVRRLVGSKRAFVVGDGKFRLSTNGLDHLKSLRSRD